MKKKNTSSKSPTPATKPAAPIAAAKPTPPPAAPAIKTKAPLATKKLAAPVPPPAKAPAPAPVVKPTVVKPTVTKPAVVAKPVVQPIAAKPVVTTITAKIDIGFGNALYVRGEGAGLSWDRGILLDCTSDDQWAITLRESARPIVFKFLVNDLSWSTGEDYVVAPGSSVNFTPTF